MKLNKTVIATQFVFTSSVQGIHGRTMKIKTLILDVAEHVLPVPSQNVEVVRDGFGNVHRVVIVPIADGRTFIERRRGKRGHLTRTPTLYFQARNVRAYFAIDDVALAYPRWVEYSVLGDERLRDSKDTIVLPPTDVSEFTECRILRPQHQPRPLALIPIAVTTEKPWFFPLVASTTSSSTLDSTTTTNKIGWTSSSRSNEAGSAPLSTGPVQSAVPMASSLMDVPEISWEAMEADEDLHEHPEEGQRVIDSESDSEHSSGNEDPTDSVSRSYVRPPPPPRPKPKPLEYKNEPPPYMQGMMSNEVDGGPSQLERLTAIHGPEAAKKLVALQEKMFQGRIKSRRRRRRSKKGDQEEEMEEEEAETEQDQLERMAEDVRR